MSRKDGEIKRGGGVMTDSRTKARKIYLKRSRAEVLAV